MPRLHHQVPRSGMRPNYRHSKNFQFDSNIQSDWKPLGYKNKWPLLFPFQHNITEALRSLSSQRKEE